MLKGIRGTALREAAQDVGAAAIYGLLFWVLWKHSIDQWYLPAGLRFAALLATPTRRWAGLYAGEFAALFLLRQYMVPFFGLPWLVVGSAALFPVTAGIVWLVKHFGAPAKAPCWHQSGRLLAGAVAAAIGSKLTVQACIFWLAIPYVQARTPEGVPGLLTHYSRFPTFVLGDLLGILMMAPATLLWLQRKALGAWPPVGLTTAWTAPAFALLFIATATLDHQWQQAACYLMFVPAAALTIAMGWRGSVLGTLAANMGIALGMHHAQIDGASDPSMLGVQTVLAVFSMSLLGAGAALSHHLSIAREQRASAERANAEATRTLELARMSLQQADQDMHDRAKRAAAGHSSWMHLSRSMIDRLRKVDPAAAMELTYTAALESRTFHGQILEAMYPLKLESEGLYTVLRSSAMIAALEETGIQIRWRLLGNASNLSTDLKRMLYRAVIEIVDTFSKGEPTTINVYVRCGSVRTRQGGAIILHADGLNAGSDPEPIALAALQHRVHIYGGSMRQHREKVTVLLSERAYVRAARAA